MKHHGDFCYLTDIGKKRSVNEDCSMIINNAHGDTLMMVCDGMGGHQKGDVAARLTIDLLMDAFNKKERFVTVRGARKWLERTIRSINEAVYNREKDVSYVEHMGTTLVACLILTKSIVVANIGDSRAYVLRTKENEEVYDFEQVTSDDTIAEYLVNMGRIKKEDREHFTSRHILTNAIGLFPSVRLEIKVLPFTELKSSQDNKKDCYTISSILLCSDGLFSMLNKEEILSSLTMDEEIENKAESLITMANNNGGDDNIAIALWETSL